MFWGAIANLTGNHEWHNNKINKTTWVRKFKSNYNYMRHRPISAKHPKEDQLQNRMNLHTILSKLSLPNWHGHRKSLPFSTRRPRNGCKNERGRLDSKSRFSCGLRNFGEWMCFRRKHNQSGIYAIKIRYSGKRAGTLRRRHHTSTPRCLQDRQPLLCRGTALRATPRAKLRQSWHSVLVWQ